MNADSRNLGISADFRTTKALGRMVVADAFAGHIVDYAIFR
jgi:hypothetical protein